MVGSSAAWANGSAGSAVTGDPPTGSTSVHVMCTPVCIAARQASVRVFAVPPVWIHIFRYAQDAELRARIRRQLNRGESRHALARPLFFANQGTSGSGTATRS